jgi:hypothetical protein
MKFGVIDGKHLARATTIFQQHPPSGFTLTWWGDLLHPGMETKIFTTPDVQIPSKKTKSTTQLEGCPNLHKLHYHHRFQPSLQNQHKLHPLHHYNANLNSIIQL